MVKFDKMRPEEGHYRQRSQMFPNLLHHESHLDVVHPVCLSHQEGVSSSDHRVQRVLSVAAGRQAGDLDDVLGRVE